MSEVGHSAQRARGDWPPSSAAPPQLPNEILPSSGQIGGIARDEVVGGLAAFPLPAGQEKHLGRGAEEKRWKTEASRRGVRGGELVGNGQQIDIAEDGEAVGKLIDAGDLSRVEYALVQ